MDNQNKKLNHDNQINGERIHPFQMRNQNLDKFRNEASSYRLSNHNKNVLSRAKCGILTSSYKSLDVLRATVQSTINQELDFVIQRYYNQFFKIAIQNIKSNNGDNAIQDHHVQSLFKQILEDAKKMYGTNELLSSKLSTPNSASNSLTFNLSNQRKRLNSSQRRDNFNENFNAINRKQAFAKRLSSSEMEKKKIKQKESSELRKAMLKKRKLNSNASRGRPPLSNKNKLTDLGIDNWNSDRITVNTKFVLGSKANKALGFGSARGRLYTKHTDLFRYIGDAEDKEYLHKSGLFPISGARAFLIIKDDIEKILQSDEYRNAPGVNGQEMGDGFELPQFIITKIKNYMEKTKSEKEKLSREQNVLTDERSAKENGSNQVAEEETKMLF